MDEMIIRSGKMVSSNNELTNLPLGVEYENLSKNFRDKDSVIDLRNRKKDNPLEMIENNKTIDKIDKSTVMLVPGLLVNYEETHVTPYPQSNVPYSNGLPWSDF